MKTSMQTIRKLLLIAILLSYGIFAVQAQVTVGSNEEPNQGALLDLKERETSGTENSERGLLLPRVDLVGVFEPKIGLTTDFSSETKIHTGLWVYNMFDNTDVETDITKLLCPGPYVWDALQWHRLIEPCKIPSAGEVICGHNISNITIGECTKLSRLGSFQLRAYGDVEITIENGDELGVVGDYKIIALKEGATQADRTYVITEANSPVYINVRVEGPNNGEPGPKTISIPINISQYITKGNISAPFDGCPNCEINITPDFLLVDPTTIIFTSGKDGLSKGYQPFEDKYPGEFTYENIGFHQDYMIAEDQVRPWGYPGLYFKENNITPSSRDGYTSADLNYWPFKVRFKPNTATITIVPVSSNPANEPNFSFKIPTITSADPNVTTESSACGSYSVYTAPNTKENSSSTVWWGGFIEMKDITQAEKFTLHGETFVPNAPYGLSKVVQLNYVDGSNTLSQTFDVRQIHYGTQILDLDGTPLQAENGHFDIKNFDFSKNEFRFKIRSNVKWECVELEGFLYVGSSQLSADYVDVARSSIFKGKYGPEEDAYGTPREEIITIKLKGDILPVPNGGRTQIRLQLANPKFVNTQYTGLEYMSIRLFK